MSTEQVLSQFPEQKFHPDLGLEHLDSIEKSPNIRVQSLEDSLEDLHRTIFTGKKALAIFGGPPGAGKSTLIKVIRDAYLFDIQFLLHTYEEQEKIALVEHGMEVSREETVPSEIRTRANQLLEKSINGAIDESLVYPRSSIVVVEAPNLGYPDWKDKDVDRDWGASSIVNILHNQRTGIETHLIYLFPTYRMVQASEERDIQAKQYLEEHTQLYNEQEKSYGGAGATLVKKFLEEFSSRSLKEAFQHPEIRNHISLASMREAAKNNLREDVDYPLQWKNIYVTLRDIPLMQPIHLSGYIVDYGSRPHKIYPSL